MVCVRARPNCHSGVLSGWSAYPSVRGRSTQRRELPCPTVLLEPRLAQNRNYYYGRRPAAGRVELHPEVANTAHRPDFLVTPLEGETFYLEAVLSTDESREQTAARARMNQVYDALNRMNSPNFFIGMTLAGAPSTTPPARRIRAFLERELSRLDPNEIVARYGRPANSRHRKMDTRPAYDRLE